jgi:tetratricopeptide (TPR) repeat protein
MIVRDAQATIATALEGAARFCDELMVVDTGSVDGTIEIAKSFGANILHFDWIDDFSAARNYSLNQCSGRWIMWLDADDRIPPEAWPGFQSIVESLDSLVEPDVILLPYRYTFSSGDPSVCTYSQECGRIFRKRPDLCWAGKVHEGIRQAEERPIPAIRRSDAWVEHRPLEGHNTDSLQRNIRILEQSLAEGDRSPRMLYYHVVNLASQGCHREALDAYDETLTEPSVAAAIPLLDRYEMAFSLALSAGAIDMSEKKVQLLGQAVVLDSTRAEAFVELGKHFCEKREWRKAMPFFAAATECSPPEFGGFDPTLYTWLPWDYLSICASEVGEFKDAIAFTLRALPGHPDRERLYKNLRIFVEHL